MLCFRVWISILSFIDFISGCMLLMDLWQGGCDVAEPSHVVQLYSVVQFYSGSADGNQSLPDVEEYLNPPTV